MPAKTRLAGQGIVPPANTFHAHTEHATMAVSWGGVVTALQVAQQL